MVSKMITGMVAAIATCFTLVLGQNPGPGIKAVPVEQFGSNATLPLMILLHGVNGPSAFSREQASFFAGHGYYVVLPHYLAAGNGEAATDANYEAWTAAVRNTIDKFQDGHRSPTVIVGFSLGASIAPTSGYCNSLRLVCIETEGHKRSPTRGGTPFLAWRLASFTLRGKYFSLSNIFFLTPTEARSYGYAHSTLQEINV